MRIECGEDINFDDVHAAFNSVKVMTKRNIKIGSLIMSAKYTVFLQENVTEKKIPHTPSFINAFQLIAMSHDLDLSGLFEEQASFTYRNPNSFIMNVSVLQL